MRQAFFSEPSPNKKGALFPQKGRLKVIRDLRETSSLLVGGASSLQGKMVNPQKGREVISISPLP